MIKSILIIISTIFMSFNIIGKSIDSNNKIKSYIGQDIQIINKKTGDLSKEGKVNIISGEGEIITDIFIKSKDVDVDSIKVGDKLKKLYDVYPSAWINEHENGVMILKGKSVHYGIATEYIIFLSQDDEYISEIQLGYTTECTRNTLPNSNKEAVNLLQGKWISKYGKEIEFNKEEIRDNQFEDFKATQTYKIISPNEMIIYRDIENQLEKVKLNFWVTEEHLYIFSINEAGIPLKDTVEKFDRIK